jgi:hypothetical protein
MAPKIVLRCGTCGTGIRHVGYDPGEPWPAAKALGWAIAKGPQGKPGWNLPRSLKRTGR